MATPKRTRGETETEITGMVNRDFVLARLKHDYVLLRIRCAAVERRFFNEVDRFKLARGVPHSAYISPSEFPRDLKTMYNIYDTLMEEKIKMAHNLRVNFRVGQWLYDVVDNVQ